MKRTKSNAQITLTQTDWLALQAFSSQAYLSINKKLLRAYGPTGAIFLANLIDKMRYFIEQKKTPDGWFFQTHEQQIEQTGMTEYTLRQCKKEFQEQKILYIEKRGLPAREWYFIDMNQLLIYLGQDLTDSLGQGVTKSGGQALTDSLGHNKNKYNKNKDKENKVHSDTYTVSDDETESDQHPVPESDTGTTPSIPERNTHYMPEAKFLAKIVKQTKDISHSTRQIKSWANDIRKLAEINKINHGRIRSALKWYKSHVGGQYIPVIESGSALRNKFTRLEDAMRRETKGWNGQQQKKNTGGSRSQGVPAQSYATPNTDILYG